MNYGIGKIIAAGVLVFIAFVLMAASSYIIEPGTRGIKVTLGKAEDGFIAEGFGWKTPMITRVHPVNVKQRTAKLKADCFSSDLQQVGIDVRVLYRIPENSVVQIYKQFAGDPFDSLVAPRVQEALKEVTAGQTAEQIVKNREKIKQAALASAKTKIGNIVSVEEIVIRDIDLSAELERAIEAKMVAEQEANRARFTQQQTEVEAQTHIIRAKGEAEAIKVRGEALKLNPAFLRLQIVEKWNGKSPLVVPADPKNNGAKLLLPLGEAEIVMP
ncbi:MAG TPA: prohibitin family protein [Candidatus Limnocylindria bacterium]|nr:prohibitin family protein [Candidatus Limnocylindria bacterium]